MAKNDNILGVEYISFGAHGDGVMGTDLTKFENIEVASLTFDGAQANRTNIATENTDTYFTVNGTAEPTTVVVRLYGVSPEDQVLLMGGSVGSTGEDSGSYMAPSSIPNIFLSVKFAGNVIDGKRRVFKIPYGNISARDQGTITKDGLPAIEVTITANTPKSAAGVSGSPYIKGYENVA